MSEARVAAERCAALGASSQQFEQYAARQVKLGELPVLRALPVRNRRLIGPWCFLDRFGPLTFAAGNPMDVAPHPHIGLQTVSWLLDGEVVHDDSLLQQALLRPGGVNVMTSGAAIAHSERTPDDNTGRLNGVQLWAALPDAHRGGAPAFQHLPEVPAFEERGGIARVFSGTLGSARSPARHYSDLVGADLEVHAAGSLAVPLNPEHEHGVMLLGGDATLEGQALDPATLYYLGTRRSEVTMASGRGARVLLVGGRPFGETILMWWNFVRRFGDVPGYPGARLAAPELAKLARPNPVS
ncbi:MAG TPA: pirin family protein [Vicinamibacterales bacterium]|nr:pirin family protein [Acidobacteriota bacterium]HOC19500.1 pirin family protein [Vicinamibacterales bacterium]